MEIEANEEEMKRAAMKIYMREKKQKKSDQEIKEIKLGAVCSMLELALHKNSHNIRSFDDT